MPGRLNGACRGATRPHRYQSSDISGAGEHKIQDYRSTSVDSQDEWGSDGESLISNHVTSELTVPPRPVLRTALYRTSPYLPFVTVPYIPYRTVPQRARKRKFPYLMKPPCTGPRSDQTHRTRPGRSPDRPSW